MLDVHAPHDSMHSWRDFLLHLITITIGLLIALSLEGIVEWQHHRHLVHEAEASLHAEIRNNATDMAGTITDLDKEQAALKNDISVLNYIIENHKAPDHSSMEVTFHIHTFDSTAWRTAESTGALAFMSYARAQEYSDIYLDQDELKSSEDQAARDAIISLGPLVNSSDDTDPTSGEAADVKQKIEVLQGQLMLVHSFMISLDQHYKKFLAAHP